MNLMVMELTVADLVLAPGAQGPACAVALTSYEHVTFSTTPDLTFNTSTGTTPDGTKLCTAGGITNTAEVSGYVNRTSVGLAWNTVPAGVTLQRNGVMRWLAVARSSLEPELIGQEASAITKSAATMLASAQAVTSAQLAAEHTAAWSQLWAGNIGVVGNVTVARAINASLYYIHSSVRDNFHYGLSPGGTSLRPTIFRLATHHSPFMGCFWLPGVFFHANIVKYLKWCWS